MGELSHTDKKGNARMVDVSEKQLTTRRAVAEAFVRLSAEHMTALDNLPKGDALTVAQIAGIAAAKKTGELIPLCHPLTLTYAGVNLERETNGIKITAEASTTAQTGVEMEALTAAAIAALTVYDMLKAIGQDIVIEKIQLLEKTGGKKDWKRTP